MGIARAQPICCTQIIRQAAESQAAIGCRFEPIRFRRMAPIFALESGTGRKPLGAIRYCSKHGTSGRQRVSRGLDRDPWTVLNTAVIKRQNVVG